MPVCDINSAMMRLAISGVHFFSFDIGGEYHDAHEVVKCNISAELLT